jgi:hypothetical protein
MLVKTQRYVECFSKDQILYLQNRSSAPKDHQLLSVWDSSRILKIFSHPFFGRFNGFPLYITLHLSKIIELELITGKLYDRHFNEDYIPKVLKSELIW